MEESFDTDQKYIKELELQLTKISEENKEISNIKTEYAEQFSAQKIDQTKAGEVSLLSEKIADYKSKLAKKESLLMGLSEKLNATQAELTVSSVNLKNYTLKLSVWT